MITDRDFVVLSDDWNGLPTSTIHLFRRFARRNRVFWFNLVNRMPRLNRRDGKRVAGYLGRWVAQRLARPDRKVNGQGATSLIPNVTTPIMLPWFKPPVRRFNCQSLRRYYEELQQCHEIHDPIVMTTFPSAVDFVKSLCAPTKIYYCVDDWLEFPGLNPRDWRTMEQELLRNVDGFVASSLTLQAKSKASTPSLYLPHGVDYEHFERRANGGPRIAALDALRRPVVGFFGLIGEWVDASTIAALARAFPEVAFVFIGAMSVSEHTLTRAPNIHYIGQVPYAELPAYAKYFDVGFIPFVHNRLTTAVNPMKLLEYYALGLPVLATRLPELERIGGPVYLASTSEEFCVQLKNILSNGLNRHASVATEIARRNTWDDRVEALSCFIESLN
ncbi:MAG: glycosyltransferase [Planctomycetia bacterium]|nr:glycosyltransferase [Planctomycetia bacterium]